MGDVCYEVLEYPSNNFMIIYVIFTTKSSLSYLGGVETVLVCGLKGVEPNKSWPNVEAPLLLLFCLLAALGGGATVV